MPDPDDSLGGETFSGEEQQDAAEQSLGDGHTMGGDANVDDELFDDGMKLEDLSERYTEEGVLGKGGFGEVMLATDTRLNRKVAIKRIQGKAVRSKTAVQRFLTEAQSIASLNHNNIVQIYDYGRATDGPFLIMECVQGGSLLEKCKAGPIELDEAVNIFGQLCDGLAKAHAAGIIHRDIKPANVLMTEDGIPKLTDFGLAKDDTADTGMTMEGAVLGTLDFMPPEQRSDSSSVDERSDLWSLAATFYQMLTGKSPKVIRERDIPVNMRDLLMQALEEDPANRFSSATEFKQALMSAASSVVVAPVKELTSGVCPACNAVNADNRKFCGECAESLRTVCLGCDIEMAVWDKICGECGGRQSELQQQAAEKAAKVAAAITRDDWEAVLALDPNNAEGLRLQAAAAKKAAEQRVVAEKIAAVDRALSKGDWESVLALDPVNHEGKRMQTAATEERTAILARAPITNTIGMTLKEIPAGTFIMGSPADETGRTEDEDLHKVTITKPFYMQTTEVTQGQWMAVMGTEPWKSEGFVKEGSNYAASYVSWDDAVAYCKQLSEKEGKIYRLPTEAEWEYACRAGTQTAWSFGDDEKVLGDYAWYPENAYDIDEMYAHQVGLKEPNGFGLHDMHGNVWEWCHDLGGPYGELPEKDPCRDDSEGLLRVYRGGSWIREDGDTRSESMYRSRSANRWGHGPFHCGYNAGFRVVRELD